MEESKHEKNTRAHILFFFFKFLFIYFERGRERAHTCGEWAERDRGRESQAGLDLINCEIMT